MYDKVWILGNNIDNKFLNFEYLFLHNVRFDMMLSVIQLASVENKNYFIGWGE